MFDVKRSIARLVGGLSSMMLAAGVAAQNATEWNLPEEKTSDWNFPEPVSPLTEEIFGLHMMTAWVATVLMIFVTVLIVYSLVVFRKDKGYKPDQNFHNSWFGRWAWVLVPVLVLGVDFAIAGKASGTLDKIFSQPEPDMTIKITGSQWKWSYEYMDHDMNLVSNLNRDLTPEDRFYLRDVDQALVLPTDTQIRLLHTSSDVLHNWWVPAVAFKVDAVPGFINETYTKITKPGIYRGQCAENCGRGHAYMPIVVEAVSPDDFEVWMDNRKQQLAAAAAEATSDKEWPLEELMQRGEEVYSKTCISCHQANGMGVPGVFAALKGSAIATGADRIGDHINIVLNGKAGTAMAAWRDQLNDLEIAAVITYERNAWGNDTGDMVQPKDVADAR